MAKKTAPKQKTGGGGGGGTNKPSSSSTAQPSTDPSSWALPDSFTPAGASLQPFLSTLPHDHVFLTHLDHTPTELKRRVFLVPCLLNLAIIAGLCVRIYYAVPTYIQQISAIFGYESPYKVDVQQASTTSLIGTVADRTLLLFIDYALFSLLGSWPREFYFGSAASRFAGPVEWRQELGFRDTEVIVRRGRKWDAPLFVQPQSGETGPAMTPSKLSKTGYLLLDKDYDLDFRAILDAHRLAEPPQEEAGDAKVERFRRALVRRKCRDVFYRWIEIVQFETNQRRQGIDESGVIVGEQQQHRALAELKTLLEAKGIALDSVLDDIGGVQELPGF
ncbi:hypothetical protein DV735_g761, partial [Chaetothyriales sp. CBS 134920]